MDLSRDTDVAEEIAGVRWLLLIHQFPAKPAYQLVKIWRRLQNLGAVAVKNAVYALPATTQTQEDFAWVLSEIRDGGGEGFICEARLLDGLTDAEVQEMFNKAHEADYEALVQDARALLELTERGDANGNAEWRAKLVRLKTAATQIVTIDFFGANRREVLEGLMSQLASNLDQQGQSAMTNSNVGLTSGSGNTWVTRQDVYVDRIASAWLIRRFIDKDAKFKFVPAKGYKPKAGELRFDMFEAEFTHEGDCCTFEVLLNRSGLRIPALNAIAQIVHDIDLKDAKFGREEAAGIARLVDGLVIANLDDDARVERGRGIFDDLYAFFGKKRR
jgi:hypothetical protein